MWDLNWAIVSLRLSTELTRLVCQSLENCAESRQRRCEVSSFTQQQGRSEVISRCELHLA